MLYKILPVAGSGDKQAGSGDHVASPSGCRRNWLRRPVRNAKLGRRRNPAKTATQVSYNGVDRIYLHQGQPDDDWNPAFVLKQFMLMWHDLHTEGSRKISGWPSAAFAHGFSFFASNALLHELWGIRLNRPLNRRAVAAGLALSTLDEIEGSDPGVEDALRLLRCGERAG